MEYETLLTPLSEKKYMPTTGMESFISFLNILEGYKTRIKNMHWAAFAMTIHERLDEFLDIVSDFQDSIAEDSMGIFGQMGPNVINGVLCDSTDPILMLTNLKAKTLSFYSTLQDKVEYAGIKSETEVFIHNLNKYTYLFKLCKG